MDTGHDHICMHLNSLDVYYLWSSVSLLDVREPAVCSAQVRALSAAAFREIDKAAVYATGDWRDAG